MAVYEDKVLHELDGIKEYDNAMPGWLMAIWWGSLIFSAAYLDLLRALSFGEGSMDSEYRGDTQTALTADAGALRRQPDRGAVAGDAARRRQGPRGPAPSAAARFAKSCASCHGEKAQGLIGPNLTDDRWIHGGSVEQVFQTITKGWPAKGMPPWGRALKPEELVGARVVRAEPPGIDPAERQAARG